MSYSTLLSPFGFRSWCMTALSWLCWFLSLIGTLPDSRCLLLWVVIAIVDWAPTNWHYFILLVLWLVCFFNYRDIGWCSSMGLINCSSQTSQVHHCCSTLQLTDQSDSDSANCTVLGKIMLMPRCKILLLRQCCNTTLLLPPNMYMVLIAAWNEQSTVWYFPCHWMCAWSARKFVRKYQVGSDSRDN